MHLTNHHVRRETTVFKFSQKTKKPINMNKAHRALLSNRAFCDDVTGMQPMST